jgi:hypothetical protein
MLHAREGDAATAADLASLRRHEGTSAAVFFAGWAKFLPVEFPFGQRSTRPPGNPVNACLSYLSAIVYGELLTHCAVRGLDPALGCLHESEDGRWSLPLDLMEPFRPALAGFMDLLLETEAGWIVVDHKSFPGAKKEWEAKALSYTGQLDCYREALAQSGRRCAGLWIHFAVGGGLIETADS